MKKNSETDLRHPAENGQVDHELVTEGEPLPQVEVGQVVALQVAAPDLLVLPDLQGPVAAQHLGGDILGNSCIETLLEKVFCRKSSMITTL